MGHDHSHATSGNLRTAFLLNVGFAILEVIGGLLTNSVAILSDALHDLGDSIALGVAWGLERYSAKAPSGRFTYGFRRFSLLAALLNAVVLITGSVFVLAEAIPRLLEPEPAHAPGMILFAFLGIGVNGLAAWRLRDGHSMNAKVATWHLLEDCLGWAAVLLVGITLLFVDLYILDPILSVVVTLYVLYNVLVNLKKTSALFLQAVPEGIDIAAIEERLRAIAGVERCHCTHLWSLDGDHHVLSTHLEVAEDIDLAALRKIKQQCREAIGQLDLSHVTLEIDLGPDDCSMEPVPTKAGTA